jgi:DNA-directed RNA polymerase subunit RPC12/RpoP
MDCPDCRSKVTKRGAFYTCERCGLSFKPWEIEKARQRARKEIQDLEDVDPEEKELKKKRERIKYRNWYEGRQEVD